MYDLFIKIEKIDDKKIKKDENVYSYKKPIDNILSNIFVKTPKSKILYDI